MVNTFNYHLFLFINTFTSSGQSLCIFFFLVFNLDVVCDRKKVYCTNAKYSCVIFEDLFGPLKKQTKNNGFCLDPNLKPIWFSCLRRDVHTAPLLCNEHDV